jgi:hypothetical protein
LHKNDDLSFNILLQGTAHKTAPPLSSAFGFNSMRIKAYIFTFSLLLTCILGLPAFGIAGDAKLILKNFLDYRGDRNFTKCCEYFTSKFKSQWARKYGNICPDWFIESEMHFKTSRIIATVDEDSHEFVVETTIEDPTADPIMIDATEHYVLISEKGTWRIDYWSIEYK